MSESEGAREGSCGGRTWDAVRKIQGREGLGCNRLFGSGGRWGKKTDRHAWLVNGYEACGGGNGQSGECAVATEVLRERREWAGRAR